MQSCNHVITLYSPPSFADAEFRLAELRRFAPCLRYASTSRRSETGSLYFYHPVLTPFFSRLSASMQTVLTPFFSPSLLRKEGEEEYTIYIVLIK